MGHAASKISQAGHKVADKVTDAFAPSETTQNFLKSHTFADALPPGSQGQLRSIEAQNTVAEAIAILNGDGAPVLSAPVLSKRHGTDLGLLDVMDILQLLAKYSVLLRQGHVAEFHAKFFDALAQDVAGIHPSDVVLPFPPTATLLEVAEGMFRVKTHRVCQVADPNNASSPIIAILSQSRLLSFLADHMDVFALNPAEPLNACNLGQARKAMVTLRGTDTALSAFEMMQAMSLSAIPIVDEQNHVINAISASNVRSLTKENSSWLLLPISEFCEKLNLQQGNYCRTTTTLVDAVQQIKKHSLHRLFVVDEAGVLVTVLTVGDVLRHLFDVAR